MDTADLPVDVAVGAAPLPGPRRYRDLLRHRPFLGLLLSHAVSLVGDGLARVALTAMVYARTGSPLLAATAFAAFFLPLVVSGPLLAGLGDRVPRLSLLVATDLIRAAIFAVMALPGMPIGALLVLIVVSGTVEAAASPARTPLLREVLEDAEGFQLASSVDESLHQVGQVFGFALGGVVVGALGARAAFSIDALTFVLSACGLLLLVRVARAGSAVGWRSMGARVRRGGLGGLARLAVQDARVGIAVALGPRSRRPLLLTWIGLAGAIAPEAVAVAWAHRLGGGALLAGFLFAANPAGTIVGLFLVGRSSPEHHRLRQSVLVVLALAPLAFAPWCDARVAVGIVAISGVGTAYSLLARVEFIHSLDDRVRARAFAVASVGVVSSQALGILCCGALADALGPAGAVGVSATTGLVACGVVLRCGGGAGAGAPSD